MTNFYKAALLASGGLALAAVVIVFKDKLTTVVGAAGFIGAFALEVLAVGQLRRDGQTLR